MTKEARGALEESHGSQARPLRDTPAKSGGDELTPRCRPRNIDIITRARMDGSTITRSWRHSLLNPVNSTLALGMGYWFLAAASFFSDAVEPHPPAAFVVHARGLRGNENPASTRGQWSAASELILKWSDVHAIVYKRRKQHPHFMRFSL